MEDISQVMRMSKTTTTIQWHEFIAAGLSQCRVDDRNLHLEFYRLDSDHKGYVIFEDIKALMGSEASSSDESIKRMFFDGCEDIQCNNARITYDDFLLLMKGKKREKPSPPPPLVNTSLNLPSDNERDGFVVSGD